LPEFRRALEADARRSVPAIKGALVKARFHSKITGLAEHIWLDKAGFEDGKIVGTIANEPVNIPELSKGESVSVPTEAVSDWMYRQGSQDFGGFTIRVMKRRGEQWRE
jgi:uncharacterized protein YegJ (DUF2314 family)